MSNIAKFPSNKHASYFSISIYLQ